MKLADVEGDLKPGVEAILAKGLDYYQAKRAFQLTLIKTEMEKNGGSATETEKSLGISYRRIMQILLDGRPGRRYAKSMDRLGELEGMEL